MIDLGNCYFHCDECPIIEGLEHRFDISEECGELQLEYCGCDKIEYEFMLGGYCEDAFSKKPKKKRKGRRKTGSAYRRRMKRLKFQRAKRISDYNCNPFVGWPHGEWINGEWIESTYMKYPRNSNVPKFLKRISNKKIRQSDWSGKGSRYKREFDYWWTLF